MKIGVIGTGRMGKILATRISADHEIVLYDADYANAKKIAESLRLAVVSLIDEMKVDVVLLAVPDNAVRSCIEKLHETGKNWTVFNVATNISREMLADMANEKVVCINTKIIGHAGEMSRGAKPVILIC